MSDRTVERRADFAYLVLRRVQYGSAEAHHDVTAY